MNMFKRWLTRLVDNWRLDEYEDCVPEPDKSRKRWPPQRRGNYHVEATNTKLQHRVSYNYDDDGVITFKVYAANGGKIIEAARYDDKADGERVKLYIIDENSDFTESFSKIVTMEYLR